MSQVITTNIASLNAQRNLTSSQASLQTSLQRLSSGLRINSAKDDAAGLAISDRMTSQISGMNQAARNANDGISMTQTVEGNLAQISANLQRMRDISVQSANDTNTASDRTSLQNEMAQLAAEVDRIASSAQFNGKNLLDGTFGTATFQVGSNAGQTISLAINSATAASLGVSHAAIAGTVTGTSSISNTVPDFMKINGTGVGASLADGVSYVGGIKSGTTEITSALALSNAVNLKTALTSVTATAMTQQSSGSLNGTVIAAGDLIINGSTIAGVAVGATDSSALVANINKMSAQTGVTAAMNANDHTAYTLTAADGRNIDISGAGLSGSVGLSAATYYGQVTLSSGSDFSITDNSIAGLSVGSYTAAGALDISSQVSSSSAITSIDSAITLINAQRATMGSMQTRFDSVVANLQSGAENLSAARSRIRDTDFAAETANLTRNQILQQAGTAMLAQANALPSNVLALLK